MPTKIESGRGFIRKLFPSPYTHRFPLGMSTLTYKHLVLVNKEVNPPSLSLEETYLLTLVPLLSPKYSCLQEGSQKVGPVISADTHRISIQSLEYLALLNSIVIS